MRLLYVLLGLLGVLHMVGCHDPRLDVKHVGIVVFGDSRAPQLDGFVAGLGALGYREGDNIRYTVLSAENDPAVLAELFARLKTEKVDLMVAAGGLEADAMRVVLHGSPIPGIVLYANSIVERALVDERDAPGWEVTGIDNLNAELTGKRLELLHALVPSVRRILIFYYPDIPPSRIGVEQAIQAAEHLGLTIDARVVHSREDIQRTMASLRRGEVDAMLTVPNAPIDNVMSELILPAAKQLRLPLMVHSRTLAEAGAVASYGATLFGIGEQAARLAAKVLNGVAASKIPFEIPKRFIYTVNVTALRDLKIELNAMTKSQVHDMLASAAI